MRALTAIYYSEPARDQGRRRRSIVEERYRGPRGPNPTSLSSFPSALTGDTLSLGDWRNPTFTVSSGI